MANLSSLGNYPEAIRLDRPRLVIGRGSAADVRLPHPAVSRRHAELRRDGQSIVVRDLSSRGGVLVNGIAVSEAVLHEDDVVAFGPITFEVKGGILRRLIRSEGVELRAGGLNCVRGGRTILTGISLTIPPNNFVGILGPSGSGKTTLLKALAGYLPVATGTVSFDGVDSVEHPEVCRTMAGFVPQEDVVYMSLTARENLDFALRLRVTGDLRPEERAKWVENALQRIGLEAADSDRPVSTLSGGQRKRVSVAIELLTRPRLLFLDEPTAGLDPATESRLMHFLQELTRRGTTVVCNTHVLESLHLFDAVLVLAGGRVLGSGSPNNLLKFFKVDSYAELYEKLESPPPVPKSGPIPATGSSPAVASRTTHTRAGTPTQTATQLLRGLTLIGRDWTLLGLLVGQPILIGFLISLSQVNPSDNLNLLYTFAVVASIWLGLNNTAREIVRERGIYVRERRATINPESYMVSKAALFALIGLAQVLLLVLWLRFVNFFDPLKNSAIVEDMSKLPMLKLVIVLWLTYLSAMFLGLIISTLADSEEVAVAALPLLVLPQLLLTGVASDLINRRPIGWFHGLDVLVSHGVAGRGVAGWLLVLTSLLTYSRPALVFFLDYEDRDQPLGAFWGEVVNWAHLLFMLLATATVFVAIFLRRERRWVARA